MKRKGRRVDDSEAMAPPSVSSKPVPAYVLKKLANNYERDKKTKRLKHLPNQADRIAALRREMKGLNIHKPRRYLTKADVEAVKAIREQLTETWQLSWDKVTTHTRWTPKQVKFAKHYALNGRSNKTGAMRSAGYDTSNPGVLLAMANKIVAIPGFFDLVAAMEVEEKARMKINVEDVVKWFNDIAMAAMGTGDFTNANRAMENLAKYLGMFVDKKEIIHRTVHSKEELDTRISELTAILHEAEPDLERKLRIN
jgi:hypothetical protein